MATTADDPVFVDTNVLVYANTVCSPLQIRAQLALQDLSASAIPLWISRQILREYLATLSRPQTFSAPVAPAALVADVVRFQTQFLIAEGRPLPEPATDRDCSSSTTSVNYRGPPSMSRRVGYPWPEQMSRKMLRNVEKRGVHAPRNGPSRRPPLPGARWPRRK